MKFASTIKWWLATLCLLFCWHAPRLNAFSLLGPFEPWMTVTNGFYPGIDIGGPMSISNGYRWNVPVVTYGFDPSFVAYFGSNGVAAVESAISLLNNLPPASQLDPANFSDDTTHINFTAANQSLIDLKSQTLFLLLEHLGLAPPDLFAQVLIPIANDNRYK